MKKRKQIQCAFLNALMEVTEGRVLYNTVRNAFNRANYKFSPKNQRALLVWYDTLKDSDYFSTLHPWQVVNRLPYINLICRKTPFVRLINRIQKYFPDQFTFLPKSYILPIQNDEFSQLVERHDKKYIIKPENGSLGSGIIILEKEDNYTPVSNLFIAQEYIESYLLDNTKFDLRVYALVASVSPLRVYVYRDGVARFCSQPNGSNTIYSQITNTAVNRQQSDVSIETITRMITDVFKQLRSKGVDTDVLWKKIDAAIALTVVSVLPYLLQGEARKCPNCGYSRCFQILGFDVLIDKDLNPRILEVNYRPSLAKDTEAEGEMKIQMLSEAIKIAAPLNEIQKFLSRTKIKFNPTGWKNYMFANAYLEDVIQKQLDDNLKSSQFVQVFPNLSPECSIWGQIIQKVMSIPPDFEGKYALPIDSNAFFNRQQNLRQEKMAAHKNDEAAIQKSNLPPLNPKNEQSTDKRLNKSESIRELFTTKEMIVRQSLPINKLNQADYFKKKMINHH